MEVVINELKYTIKEVDVIDKKENEGEIIGLTKYVEQEILLLKSLSKEQKIKTLRHELTHVFLWAYGFGQVIELPIETICEFIGIYSKKIANIADKYFKESEE